MGFQLGRALTYAAALIARHDIFCGLYDNVLC